MAGNNGFAWRMVILEMKNMKTKTIIIAVLLLVVSSVANAQEAIDIPKINIGDLSNQAASPADCFDYYKFQSVQVSLGADKDAYNPGEEINFQGELINENSYPVVDGYVFARIGRRNENYTEEGHFTIDEIIPFKDINLDANERKNVNFNWTIPENIAGGVYRIDFFFSVGKKFNLGGLPFTNEVVIGGAEFQVVLGNTQYVAFDKAGTKVNGEKYNHIGSWPQIDPDAKVEIAQPLKNTFSKEQVAVVQYDLYFWDSLDEKDKISSKQEEITIPANSSAELNYVVSEMKDSVYLLKITATVQNQKSIVNIRLTSDQSHPRLNYPAVTKFPFQKGDNATVFSCFYNTSGLNSAGTVSVVLEDKAGKKIGAMEYDGEISSAMMADKKEFSPQKDYSWVKLIATLKDKEGKIMDQYETIYDCEKINSSACRDIMQKVSDSGEGVGSSSAKKIVIFFIIMLSIVSLILIFRSRKGRAKYFSLLAMFIVGGSALIPASVAEGYYAKTKTSSYRINTGTWNFRNMLNTWINLRGNASILHKVDMVKGRYDVGVGDEIDFAYNPELPFFNNTGSFWDSPYGKWCPKFASKPCGGTWQLFWSAYGNYDFGNYDFSNTVNALKWSAYGNYDFSNTVNALKPAVSVSSSNPDIVKCTGMDCAAISPGKATLTANISSTEAKLWAWLHVDGIRVLDYYDSRDFSFPAASVSWNITVTDKPASVTGVCGPAAKTYLPTDLAFSGAFCTAGTQSPAAIGFPTAGNDAVWHCNGTPNDIAHRSSECRASITAASDFNLNLQINKSGEGDGSVSFSPAKGSSCSASCTKTYDSGTSVTMTASSSNGSSISWGGGCDSKSGNSCRVNMNSNKDVSVTFSKPTPPIPPPPESPSKEWKEVAP